MSEVETTQKIEVRSLMKPFMNALYGIAVQEGKSKSRTR